MTLPEEGAAMGQLMTDTLKRLRRLPLVSFACVEGGAYCGGAELATACDFRIFEAKAMIQFVQVCMGVSPAWGGGIWCIKSYCGKMHSDYCAQLKSFWRKKALKLKLADFTLDATRDGVGAAICSFVTPFDLVTSAVSHGCKTNYQQC
ncbi:unnamed protein product [Peronospora belbahrii]|nr:unnamed protein product [Peronospora belbahrii]